MMKFLWLLLAVGYIQGYVVAQENENDVTEIPFANAIEGSGIEPIEDNIGTAIESKQPQLEPILNTDDSESKQQASNVIEEDRSDKSPELPEDPVLEDNAVSHKVQPSMSNVIGPIIDDENQEDNSSLKIPCPEPCLCSIEGEDNKLVVNCAGHSLTEFPSPLDTRTSILNLNNNKLTEIPKDITKLKNLTILNANNNSIMDLAPGSISELPALIKLELANNRLIEYPQDLKNSISLTKLKELDLGGNDIRTTLTPELFSSLQSLQKVTLPLTTPDLIEDLCSSFKTTLETICSESCKKQTFDCPDTIANMEKDLLDAPGVIAVHPEDKKEILNNVTNSPTATTPTVVPEPKFSTTEFSLRDAVNKEPVDNKALNAIVEAPKDLSTETEVKIGAKTSETGKGGGVDKSVIGIIVAGMIVIVAVIVIKKNWNSIKTKFSSTPRPNDRTPHANGTTPEEVPLQDKTNDKSPV